MLARCVSGSPSAPLGRHFECFLLFRSGRFEAVSYHHAGYTRYTETATSDALWHHLSPNPSLCAARPLSATRLSLSIGTESGQSPAGRPPRCLDLKTDPGRRPNPPRKTRRRCSSVAGRVSALGRALGACGVGTQSRESGSGPAWRLTRPAPAKHRWTTGKRPLPPASLRHCRRTKTASAS